MSDRRSSSDLGSSAEATLGAFPFPERDWESDARAIEAIVAGSTRASTDASLLAAPLPSEAGEPSSVSATATPLTNSGVRTQSLTELARRSVERKQAAERQMARESLALAAQQRQRSPENDAAQLPARVSVSAATNAAAGAVPQKAAGGVSETAWPKVALVLPALALAAAVLLWFRRPEPEPLVANALAPVTASTPAVVSTGAASPLAQQPASAPEEAPRGVDPSTLTTEASDPAKAAAGSAGAAIAASPRGGSKAPANERTASESKALDRGLPPDPALRPADSLGGELPAKPSTGAVQAALGAVLSGARHCVAGDDAPSSAVVVFGSDGRVQQVTVSGAAAGKSSATCIEAQLRRARVQPFAAASFSVNATVRPE